MEAPSATGSRCRRPPRGVGMPRGATLSHLTAGGAPAPRGWRPHDGPRGWLAHCLAEAARARSEGGRGSVIVVPDHRDVARVDAALTTLLGPGGTSGSPPTRGRRRSLHRLAQGAAWACAGGGRHPRCGVCAGAGPRAGVVVGRRRRPARRAAGALPPRAGGARGPGASRGRRAARRWLRPHGGHPGVGRQRRHEADRRTPRHGAPPGARGRRAPSSSATPRRRAPTSRPSPGAPRRGPGTGTGARAGAPPRVPPSLSCQTCRAPARCAQCHGPLALPAPGAAPSCRWCGTATAAFECVQCGGRRCARLSSGPGGRPRSSGAFPGVPVHTSGSGEVLDRVAGTPSLVIATPGAEPVADGGYAAVLLLDAWASLDRPALTAGESRSGAGWAPPRWPGGCRARRGRLCGAPGHTTIPAVETLVRWDPAWFAERELAERRELRLPPPCGWLRSRRRAAPCRRRCPRCSCRRGSTRSARYRRARARRGSCCGQLSTTGRPSRGAAGLGGSAARTRTR